MGLITKIKVSGTTHNIAIPYGVCDTAAGTAAKTVSIADTVLVEGAQVIVRFTNGNTAASPTLNISSLGAKSIICTAAGAGLSATNWAAGATITFTYNGTAWVMNNVGAFNSVNPAFDGGTLSVANSSSETGALSGGGLTAGSGEVSITQPSITHSIDSAGTFVKNASTYGVTTAKPSGTDGTNYLTANPTATVTKGTAKGRGTVSRAAINRAKFSSTVTRGAVLYNGIVNGYVSKADNTQALASGSTTVSLAAGSIASTTGTSNWSAATDNITPATTAGSTYYIPVVTASATANGGSASITKQPTASASATQTGMTAGVSSTETSYYFTSSASSASGVITATGGSASASVGKGITAGASTGTKTGSSATTTEKTASDSSKVYLKAATCTVAGGGLSQGTESGGSLSGGNLTAGDGGVKVESDSINLTSSKSKPTSGYYITATGWGSVNRNPITLEDYSMTVTRAAITDTHTAGYLPAKSATTVIAAASSTVKLQGRTTDSALGRSNDAIMYYKLDTASIENGASSGTSSGTIGYGNLIKFGKGYNPADVYYRAKSPTGNYLIESTSTIDVSDYATARVSAPNLVASNIRKDINILGVVGTYTASSTASGTYSGNYANNISSDAYSTVFSEPEYTWVNPSTNNVKFFDLSKNVNSGDKIRIVALEFTTFSIGNPSLIFTLYNSSTGATQNIGSVTFNQALQPGYTSSAVAVNGTYNQVRISNSSSGGVYIQGWQKLQLESSTDFPSGYYGLVTASGGTTLADVGSYAYVAVKKAGLGNSYTPGTSSKSVYVKSEGWVRTNDAVATIAGDSNLIAANIKSGVQIFGVTGTHAGPKTEQTKTVALSMASGNQTISADSGKVLTSVTITKPSTLIASNIKSGVSIGGVTGTYAPAATTPSVKFLGLYNYIQRGNGSNTAQFENVTGATFSGCSLVFGAGGGGPYVGCFGLFAYKGTPNQKPYLIDANGVHFNDSYVVSLESLMDDPDASRNTNLYSYIYRLTAYERSQGYTKIYLAPMAVTSSASDWGTSSPYYWTTIGNGDTTSTYVYIKNIGARCLSTSYND